MDHGSDLRAGALGRHILDTALLQQSLEYQAEIRPDAIAIDEGARSITYRALRDSMNAIAGALMSLGVRRHDRVVVLLDNGINATSTIVAALRTGGCYVPINPAFPGPRAAAVLDDSEPAAIVTSRAYLSKLSEIVAVATRPLKTVILMVLDAEAGAVPPPLREAFREVLGAPPAATQPLPPCLAVEEDLAYIMYTSGTTGRPKGVMVSHRNVKSFVLWANDEFKLTPADRMSHHSRISFDLSVFDIFGCLFAGATNCPVTEPGDLMFPGKFIRERRLTIWFSVPSVIGTLRKGRQLNPKEYPDLRLGIFCGEALTADFAEAWTKANPTIPTYNIYGPTEATIACTYFRLTGQATTDSLANVPIGFPCRDTEILILKLDEDVAVGPQEVGRLMICGSQVASGYWRRPDLNEKAFTLNPEKREFGARMYDSGDLAFRDAAGVLHWVARRDQQIKIAGFRVELGEIEAALSKNPLVNEAGVVYLPGDPPSLLAAVALSGDRPPGDFEEELLDHCARLLPSYMVPTAIHVFAMLPKNANGKIDRGAIKTQLSAIKD